MLILRTPHSDKVLIDESLGTPTTFMGRLVAALISLIRLGSWMAVTNSLVTEDYKNDIIIAAENVSYKDEY